MSGTAAPGSNAPTPARPQRRRLALLVVCVGCLLLGLVLYAPASRLLTRTRGEHLTVEEARALVRLDFPAAATDVRCYQHTRPDQLLFADFAIAEPAFLAWATAQRWAVEPVVGSTRIWPRLGFGDRKTSVRVADGFTYRNHRQRGAPDTIVVTYDRAAGRAYYAYWSAPRDEDG